MAAEALGLVDVAEGDVREPPGEALARNDEVVGTAQAEEARAEVGPGDGDVGGEHGRGPFRNLILKLLQGAVEGLDQPAVLFAGVAVVLSACPGEVPGGSRP